jgi:hypothetical protein
MKVQFKTIGSLLGIAALLLVGVGVTPVYAGGGYQAVNDYASTTTNLSINIDVFANDTGNYNEYTLTVETPPNHGDTQVSINAGSAFITYFPDFEYRGDDSFTYNACETGYINCRTATVYVTIGSMDSDLDGITDSQEPGDINGDGTMDKFQNNVTAINGGYLSVNSDCTLSNVKDFTSMNVPNVAGLTASSVLTFEATGCPTANVVYSFNNFGTAFADLQIQKYGLNSAGTLGWFDFKSNTTVPDGVGLSNLVIEYTLTDGGIGDNGLDGKIVDPIVIYTNSNIAQTGLIRTGGIF